MAIFKNREKVMIQTLAAFSASISFLLMGTVRAYSSPAMPSLNATVGHLFHVDDFALFASLPPVGSFTAALLLGPLLKYLGRRRTIMATSVPWSASFLMIGLSGGDKLYIFAGRVIMGAMIGFAAPATQIYIAECSSPSIRGTLGSLTALMLAFGIVLTYATGIAVEWDVLALILSTFPLLLLISMFFMPESPTWLLSKNDPEGAWKSLQKLRGKTDISREFVSLLRISRSSMLTQQLSWRIVDDILKPSSLKALGISTGLMVFQQISGINVVIYFTVTIFRAAGSTINDYIATLIVGIVQLVCTFPAVFLVDKFGRRILLIVSGSFMAVSLFAMATYFYFLEATSFDLANIGWLPLASLILFIVAYSGGYSNVPYLVMSELFPSSLRNLFGSLSACANLTSLFVMLYTFPILSTTVGNYSAFWMYALFNCVGVIFVYFLVPETKGKSLEEIQRFFEQKSSKNQDDSEVKFVKASSVDEDEVSYV